MAGRWLRITVVAAGAGLVVPWLGLGPYGPDGTCD